MVNGNIPAAYIMFASPMNKKFSYKAGLRGELSAVSLRSHHDEVDQTKNSFFIAPSISGVYKISEKQDISLALSRRIGRPTYPQLNPYMSMVDAMTYEQGNMHLRPERTTKSDLSYNIKSKAVTLFINGYLTHTKDYISQITMIDAGRLITTYVNADMDMKSGVDVSMRIDPAKWKGAMTVSILLTDVFNTAKWEVSSHNNIFYLTNISRNKSRMMWLGLSYNFNSFKQKSAQQKETDRSLIKLGL